MLSILELSHSTRERDSRTLEFDSFPMSNRSMDNMFAEIKAVTIAIAPSSSISVFSMSSVFKAKGVAKHTENSRHPSAVTESLSM